MFKLTVGLMMGGLAALISQSAVASDVNFKVQDLAGKEVDLAKQYQGKVLLVVNVASQCGLTPQYKDLQALYEKYKNQGLCILAFPCNQFGYQEPGSADEIRQFCSTKYAVSFDLFAKIEVNGNGADPFYKHLKKEQGGMLGSSIKWNFTKFLVDRQGKVVDRFGPSTAPAKLAKPLEKLLTPSPRQP